MNIIHSVFSEEHNNSFVSSSGLAHIFVQSWVPENPDCVKGIFQITHGMAEHSNRYEDFAKFLASMGYAVFAHDHIGHGKSVKDSKLGYFGEDGDCYKHLIEDVHSVTLLAKSIYPKLPVILFGHSMGSFVARGYLSKYGNDVNGAIICGTSGSNPAASLAIKIVNILSKFKGNEHRSLFINNLAFSSYNKKFARENDGGFSWLSKNKDNVDKYNEDSLCGYCFTLSGFRGLFGILDYVSKDKCYNSISSDLPVLLIAGEDDPVGNYSKGVKEVYDKLIKTNHTKTEIKLWKNLRHEILNEDNKDEIYFFIASWIEKALISR